MKFYNLIKPKTIKILGIPIFNGDTKTAIELIYKVIDYNEKPNLLVSASGAHGLIESTKNLLFKGILRSFYLNLPDGQPSVWVAKLKGAKFIKRCYGPNFFRDFLIHSSTDKHVNHFFCGGMPGVAAELKEAVKIKFSNNNVCGIYCPPFLPLDEYDYRLVAELVEKTNANIIWIGLSTPKQEQFAFHLSKFVNVVAIICVGAAFDFHTDKLKQAPVFLQKAGLEWFFRLLVEPKRLYKRYMEIVPKFIFYNLIDLFKLKNF
jgi:N-acetylglucosaminyldiphosphoundecaprenol N-acetyl-beta-D-mannosaminyltransferase